MEPPQRRRASPLDQAGQPRAVSSTSHYAARPLGRTHHAPSGRERAPRYRSLTDSRGADLGTTHGRYALPPFRWWLHRGGPAETTTAEKQKPVATHRSGSGQSASSRLHAGQPGSDWLDRQSRRLRSTQALLWTIAPDAVRNTPSVPPLVVGFENTPRDPVPPSAAVAAFWSVDRAVLVMLPSLS